MGCAMKKKTKRLTLDLPEVIYERMKKAVECDPYGRSITQFVIMAIGARANNVLLRYGGERQDEQIHPPL